MLVRNTAITALFAYPPKRALVPTLDATPVRFAGEADNRQIRVLIVEDRRHYQEGIQQLLTKHGFTVIPEIPTKPAAALEAIRRHKPHVILVDDRLFSDEYNNEFGEQILKMLMLERALAEGKDEWSQGGSIRKDPGFRTLTGRMIWIGNSPKNLCGTWGVEYHFPKDQFMPGSWLSREYHQYDPQAQDRLVQAMQRIYTRTREQQEAIDTFLDNNDKPRPKAISYEKPSEGTKG